MRATVIYDGDCGICNRLRELCGALDWFGTLDWIPQQSPEAARFGIPADALRDSMYLISADGPRHGWSAVKGVALRLPVTYIAGALAIRKRPLAALALAALFSPLMDAPGERAYKWVAQNRYRLPGSTCAVPVWDNRVE